jgi:hypothetical protein
MDTGPGPSLYLVSAIHIGGADKNRVFASLIVVETDAALAERAAREVRAGCAGR